MTFPTESIPLFVYGSLRPGMALWPEIRDHVITAEPATAQGRLVWHSGGEWPLLLDGNDLVQGDLVHLHPGAAPNAVLVDEELRFGYDARWIPVTLRDGTQVDALVFIWPRDSEVGAPIAGGDYVEAERTRSGRE
ncbi:gamma-glutamylcyclotransferase [Microbacterium lacus]|uniref:gamma-glutamylcyclotransferase family protein n=1 Tax=Microbacterium lacus TaxID=415217 RepID=UPI00384E4780